MGRSVSTPSGAVAIAYRDTSHVNDEWEWDFIVEDITQQLITAFPSLEEASGWIGREDRIVLENQHAKVTISEYCGLTAVSLVPVDRECYYSEDVSLQNLSLHWCDQISGKFNQLLGEFNKVGTFSNGEAVFERISH